MLPVNQCDRLGENASIGLAFDLGTYSTTEIDARLMSFTFVDFQDNETDSSLYW